MSSPFITALLSRISELAVTAGAALKLRGHRTGGAVGNVPVKTGANNFEIGWLSPSNLSAVAGGGTTARTIASHLRNTLNPMDFGAAGDGNTNDRSAIVNALAQLGGNRRTLDLQGRRYAIDGAIFLPEITGIRITNGTLVALSSVNWNDGNAMIMARMNRQVVDNITFECANAANGVRITAQRVTVAHCTMLDIKRHGIFLNSGNCNIIGNIIRQIPQNSPDKASTTIRTADGITVKSAENLITANDIYMCRYSVYLDDGADRNTFTGNHFWDSAGPSTLTRLVYVAENARHNRFSDTYSENGLWEIRCLPSRIAIHGLNYTLDASQTSAPTVFRFVTSTPNSTIAGASIQGLVGLATSPPNIFGFATSGSGSWSGNLDKIREGNVGTMITQQPLRVVNSQSTRAVQRLVSPHTNRAFQYFEGSGTTETIGHGCRDDDYVIETKGEERIIVKGGNTSTEVRIKNIFESGTIKLSFYDVNSVFAAGWEVGSSTGNTIYRVGSTELLRMNQNDLIGPGTDDAIKLGSATYRWSVVYSATGTINTSDLREKQQVRPLDEAERAVATTLKGLVRAYKFNSAVAAKGDAARIHVGVIAQEVKAAFEAQGLVAEHYGILCHDTFENGSDRYGVRYEELFAFIIAAL